jgi:ABC-type Fe3+ transport system substrate-binding protein
MDIMSNSDPQVFEDLSAAGSMIKLTKDEVPAIAGYPADALHPSSLVYGRTPFEACWNTSLTDGSKWTTWKDVLLSNAGKVGTPNPVSAYLPAWVAIEKAVGDDVLKQASGNLSFQANGTQAAQTLGSGETPVLALCAPSAVAAVKAAGAPVDSKLICPTSGFDEMVGISATAPHPAAARLYINFLASAAAQKIYDPQAIAPTLPEGDAASGVIATPKDCFSAPDIAAATASQAAIYAALGYKP